MTIRVVYMMFLKCSGTLGGHRGHLCEVWEGYGDPRGHRGSFILGFGICMGTLWGHRVVYLMFGKCMGTLGGHRGRLCEVWEVYGDPRGS